MRIREGEGNMAERLRRLSVKQLRKWQRFESFYCQRKKESDRGSNPFIAKERKKPKNIETKNIETKKLEKGEKKKGRKEKRAKKGRGKRKRENPEKKRKKRGRLPRLPKKEGEERG
jgi:hypothetical protein